MKALLLLFIISTSYAGPGTGMGGGPLGLVSQPFASIRISLISDIETEDDDILNANELLKNISAYENLFSDNKGILFFKKSDQNKIRNIQLKTGQIINISTFLDSDMSSHE